MRVNEVYQARELTRHRECAAERAVWRAGIDKRGSCGCLLFRVRESSDLVYVGLNWLGADGDWRLAVILYKRFYRIDCEPLELVRMTRSGSGGMCCSSSARQLSIEMTCKCGE